ncbi:MAG: GAF domain-containing protein [Candidatus Heimdallarchaeota archaeon]|nr:GAF domain-containing protein [Candidatus Heimdallarchaeota archaeon]
MLKEKEYLLNSVFRHSPEGIILLSKGEIIDANPSSCDIMGYTKQEILTMQLEEMLYGDSWEQMQSVMNELQVGQKKRSDMSYITKSKEIRYLEMNTVKIEDHSYMLFIRDNHVKKQAELSNNALLRLIQYADGHDNIQDLLQRFLDEAEALTLSKIGFYHFVEEDEITLSLQAWSTNTLNNMCTAEGEGQHYPISKAGVWVDCVRERKPVIHNDYAALLHKKGLPVGHAPIIRELVVPIFREGRVVAVLGVGNKETDYNLEDAKIVEEFAELAWEVVRTKRVKSITKNKTGYTVICSYCKDIRKKDESWERVENYITTTTPTTFSHSICESCYQRYFE